jgi:DNA-binding response OmpR family regulator
MIVMNADQPVGAAPLDGAALPDQEEAPAARLNRDRVVLVVDDDAEIRDVVRWLLEDEGWIVETASDGRDAVDQATRARPALIVLDMGLPIMNGEEVARRVQAVYADPPPIIVVSADGRAGEKAARLGAASYLHKPFDVDELARRVRQTLSGT